ncbi:MarR family winged helix-turn-helix transcriptional regulator [Rhodococcoides kyotonense]|uniref:MarR family protein n=1 Tax=Rhodococcoides kyotonense TaxID=398843 RepID=A0A239N7Z5_9NOCA|nr:MarR family transcriptional regulator [Rhodococcus kyotonensis]SNT51041.1 MarR family protein [Rhodococcus kyotonensis]
MNAEDVWRDLRTLMFEQADPHGSVVAATGVSFFRCKLLRRLQPGPMSAGELAEVIGSDPPYVSITLRELESRGYLVRTEDPKDRRRRLVELTGEGREIAARADRALAAPPASLSALSDNDIHALGQIVSSLLR